jgi:hypothetical protein
MLERIQAFAGLNGLIAPRSIQVFDQSVALDPLTDQPSRVGDLRLVELSDAARQRIADAINAELGGEAKAAQRLTAARTAIAERAAKEREAAKTAEFQANRKPDDAEKTKDA